MGQPAKKPKAEDQKYVGRLGKQRRIKKEELKKEAIDNESASASGMMRGTDV